MPQQGTWLPALGLVLLVLVTLANCLPAYDFIVVGSGAGGGAVARRLAENGKFTVLLIESGGFPGTFHEVPSYAPVRVSDPSITFRYQSIPQRDAAQTTDRIVSVVSGRMLGGTTSLNYMWFNRGHPFCFDNWARITGDDSWSYRNMLKYFRRVETYKGEFPSNVHHGSDGPVTVSRPFYSPGLDHWLAAGLELGYPIKDPNGPQQRSFTPVEFSKKHGMRVSSFTGYLEGKLKTSNLEILMNTNVTQVIFQGKRAVGVRFISGNKIWERSSQETEAFANKEVILSAGAYNSPLILQRSGIGPASLLYAAKIPIVNTLPTGFNMQQHPAINLNFAIQNVTQSIVMDERTDLTPENWQIYRIYGDGPFSASTGATGQAFLSSVTAVADGHIDWPDLQICMSHSTRPYLETDDLYMTASRSLNYGEVVMSASVWLGRPKSRGSISINPKNVWGDPILDMGYLSDYRDMQTFLDGIRKTLHIFERTKAYQNLGARYAPIKLPACKKYPIKTKEYWICYIQQTLQGGCHPAGTNKMGRYNDPTSVVDPELRVIGTESLRVVDASIMPFIINANPQASVYAIAEKAADMILKKWDPESEFPSQENRYPYFNVSTSTGSTSEPQAPRSSSQSIPHLLGKLVAQFANLLSALKPPRDE